MAGILDNLLNQALTIIPGQTGQIQRFNGRTKNARKQYVSTYDDPVDIQGSFQAVPREKFELFGLDLKKVYYMLYTSENADSFKRGESGDIITYAGMTFEILPEGGWKPVDDWTGIMLVEVGDR